MTYIAGTRANTSEVPIRDDRDEAVSRRVSRKTLLNKIRSEDIRRSCKEKDIKEWAH